MEGARRGCARIVLSSFDEPGRGIPWCGCVPAEPTSVSHDGFEYSMALLSFEASLFACFFEFLVTVFVNLVLSPFEFVLGGDVAEGTVQSLRVVVFDVFGDESLGIAKS